MSEKNVLTYKDIAEAKKLEGKHVYASNWLRDIDDMECPDDGILRHVGLDCEDNPDCPYAVEVEGYHARYVDWFQFIREA